MEHFRGRPPIAGQQEQRHPASQLRLFARSAEAVDSAPEFFIFIKDYGWSLRYRMAQLATSVLDMSRPLLMDWVKLKSPIKDPERLLQPGSGELFDWNVLRPPQHKGFEYHVIRAFDSGVEAVINFIEGRGLSLLVGLDSGIQLLDRGAQKRAAAKATGRTTAQDSAVHPVTHCWVECLGMPFLPIVSSVKFYDMHEVVAQYRT